MMGLPEWMLAIDSRNTKTLHGGACIQMIIHFKGPKAHQLDVDFSKLLSSGRLEEPSVFVPGYIDQKRKKKLGYRQCGARDPNEGSSSRKFFYSQSSSERHVPRDLLIILASAAITILYKY